MPSVSGREIRRTRSSKNIFGSSDDRSDPLSLAIQPPLNESLTDKQARIQHEREAKQRSDEIDRLLKQDETNARDRLATTSGSAKKGRAYKMVLLGQAGAGKTTVLKQMRLLYDPQAHERERKGWAKIVLLNLTSSVRVLLETMEKHNEERSEPKSIELAEAGEGAQFTGMVGGAAPEPIVSGGEVNTNSMPWARHLPNIVALERELRRELGAFDEEVILSESHEKEVKTEAVTPRAGTVAQRTKSGERSPLLLRSGWQERLFTYARKSFSMNHSDRDASHTEVEGGTSDDDGIHETVSLLRSVQGQVLALWNDDLGCRALRKRGLFLDGQSDAATSYFLDSFTRITSLHYSPTDEDILHSRVRTLGVTEEIFRVDRNLKYRIYDVGGSRSQRAAWIPFLDDVESIVFLAPLSAFDQPLVEDPTTNRLADTFALFDQIVANPLLQHTTIILFLNKIDLLEKKLRQGVRLQRYWPEYDGDNDFEAVWRWFRSKFRDCLRRAEEEAGGGKRKLYVHTTVATSTKQIQAILMSVKDAILRDNLRVAGLV